MTITVTYTANWQIKTHPWYKWTECRKLINTRTGKEIMKSLKGTQPGYYIDKKFVKLEDLRDKRLVELIVDNCECPF